VDLPQILSILNRNARTMNIHTILFNCMAVPHPEAEEFHLVYEIDVKRPRFMERIQGIKKPVYWTTPAVMALLNRAKDES
jgi:hypothetical protein